ncbi:MAG: MFS transporter [Bacteroidales bacterium]|nr:MFS transporter [Bacteroidales bacterium]
MPVGINEKHDAFAVLKIKDFSFFLLARFILTFAILMQSVIVGWQVYQITNDVFSLGLIGLAEAIPFLSIALYAGHIADLFNRKKIIVICSFVYFLCALALFLLTYKFSNLLVLHGAFPIYVIIFITGLSRGFLYPSQTAFMAQIVPRNLYTNSSTWNSSVWHIAAITGPAVGGLIYGFFGINMAYLTVVVFVALSILFYFNIKSKPVPPKEKEESIFESLKTGLKFVFKNQILLSAISLDMFAVLFGGAVAILPVFAGPAMLNVGPQGLGFLRAAPAFGAILMAVYLAYKPPLKNSGKKLLISVVGFGLCIIFFAISNNFYLSLVLLALSGVFDNVSVILRFTIMQLLTPDNMRGRVASINSIFIGSSNEIGAFESGLAARLLGVIPSVIFGGSMTLLITGIAAKFAPKLRKLDLNKEF